MTNRNLFNVAGCLLSGYAAAVGSLAWLARPVYASPPWALVADVPPVIATSDVAFWTGISGLLTILVNAAVGAWGKRQDAKVAVAKAANDVEVAAIRQAAADLEIKMLKQAAVDKAANDELKAALAAALAARP